MFIREIRGQCVCVCERLVFHGLLDVVDDENLHGRGFGFEFQTKLLLEGGFDSA